jgi:DNA-binding NtrC family response regulator
LLRDFANAQDPVRHLPQAILIVGETGTGKEAAAHAVHLWLERPLKPDAPFRVQGEELKPASIEWAQKLLCGREANAQAPGQPLELGAIDHASGGTLHLDEFQDASKEAQGLLLELMERGTYRRFGGNARPLQADVKLVCTMNEDPEDWVKKDRLRPDILRRFRAAIVHLPPLRERRQDIPELAKYCCDLACTTYGGSGVLTQTAMGLLESTTYHWPLNVGSLESVITSALLSVKNRDRGSEWVIDEPDVANALRRAPFYDQSGHTGAADTAWPSDFSPEQVEKWRAGRQRLEALVHKREQGGQPPLSLDQRDRYMRIVENLIRAKGNRAAAAKLYGKNRTHFQKLLQTFDIDGDDYK